MKRRLRWALKPEAVMSWDWSTLIAGLGGGVIGGGLTVVAGFMAYKGVQSQIADLQAERTETDRRRLSVIKWAVMAAPRSVNEDRGLRRALLSARSSPKAITYATRQLTNLDVPSIR